MRTRPLLLPALVLSLLVVPPVAARRRAKPVQKVTGQLVAPFLQRVGGPPQRAYWAFGLPGLQEQRPRGRFDRFAVFLSVWEDERVAALKTPALGISGAAFTPRLLVIPRRSDRETVELTSQDLFRHHLKSAEHRELANVVLAPNGKATVTLESIPPLQTGQFVSYVIGSRDLPRMRGELLFLRATVYTVVDEQGRFSLDEVPHGEHTLSVYYGGKVIHTQKIEVGRRLLELQPITLTAPR